MKKSIFVSNSPRATKTLGQKVAKSILGLAPGKHAVVVSLEGELGSGKTTFSQGFAKGLGIKERVLSPTFVIVKPYKLPFDKTQGRQAKNYKLFYHIDCYRLHNTKELPELGFKKMIENPRAILLIEWGNRVKRILPKHTIRISFSH